MLTRIKTAIQHFILEWARKIEIDEQDRYYSEHPEETQ